MRETTSIEEKVRRAWERRALLRAAGCTAWRLLNGAGDGLPGATCDRLGGWGMLRLEEGARAARGELLGALLGGGHLRGVYERAGAARGATLAAGEEAPEEIEVAVDGLRYGVRPRDGDKAGLYLDQRENRALFAAALLSCRSCGGSAGSVNRHSDQRTLHRTSDEGLSVLNLYAFTCAWSVAAAAFGAGATTNVDTSRGALDRGRANFQRNGLDPAAHRFVTADAADYLGLAAKRGWRFGAIVLDPPSFSHGRRGSGRFEAARDYPALLRAALAVLEDGGILAACSHARTLPGRRIEGLIQDAAREAGRRAEVVEVRGSPSDFPVPERGTERDPLRFCLARIG